MKTDKPMLEYLANCSKVTLESFVLARLNDRANLRKELNEVLDELIEIDIQSRIAEWILVYKQEQAALPRRTRRPRRAPALDVTDLQLPLLPPDRPDEFRSEKAELEADIATRKPIAPHRVSRMPRMCTRTAVNALL